LASEKDKLETFFKGMGTLISKFRKEKKFSLEELGLRIGLDRSHMHRIENGQPLTVRTILKLCLALDKKPKDFFDIDFKLHPQELGGLVKSKKSPKKKVKSKPRKR
jgi:transcriptional regulator with XRE-family HTH domain